MKTYISVIIISFLWFSTKAQTEIKLGVGALILGAGHVNLEMGLGKDFGLEGEMLVHSELFGAAVSLKHYFDPKRGLDRFNVGLFIAHISEYGTNLGFGPGCQLGYKWTGKRRIFFEIGFGVGFPLDVVDGVLINYKLHVGYRFRKKYTDSEKIKNL